MLNTTATRHKKYIMAAMNYFISNITKILLISFLRIVK